MHYLTDVLAGALASGIWLTVVLVVLLPNRLPTRAAPLEPDQRKSAGSPPTADGHHDRLVR